MLSEQVVDETRRLRLSIAAVELPDGVRFEQYVLRMPKAAMVVVLNDRDEVLMMWRHRFTIDRWVSGLPGGYVDPGEEPVGTADAENLLFLASGADYVGEPIDINEAERVAWIPLASVRDLIAQGELVGAASQVGPLHVLAFPPSGLGAGEP